MCLAEHDRRSNESTPSPITIVRCHPITERLPHWAFIAHQLSGPERLT
jgi:hypothetical protein